MGRAKQGGRKAINRELDKRLGALLRQRRIELGWSQMALGKKIDLTFQQVQKYENGTNQLSVARLLQLCEVLRVPVGYFLETKGPVVEPDGPSLSAWSAVAGVADDRVRTALIRLARAASR